jgi:hypothetical protein
MYNKIGVTVYTSFQSTETFPYIYLNKYTYNNNNMIEDLNKELFVYRGINVDHRINVDQH